MKLLLLILIIQSTMQIYDVNAQINPSVMDPYTLTNGGLTTQGYWGSLSPSPSNVFNYGDWSGGNFKQMYNLNSLAPYSGDRTTGYDSFVPMMTPPGITSSSYHPPMVNLNTDQSLSPNMADFNTPMYRNFYKRYYSFYTRNLDVLKAKLAVRSDPNDMAEMALKKATHGNIDFKNNYFDEKPIGKSMISANLDFVDTLRGVENARKLEQVEPELTDRQARLEVIKTLKSRINEIHTDLEEMEREVNDNNSADKISV